MNQYIKLEFQTEGRRLVIPDIHGCYKTLEALLQKIDLTEADMLIFLGDYIDRGPSSLKTVDMVIKLMESHPNVFAIRGNHEQMILDQLENFPNEIEEYLSHYNSSDLLINGKIPDYIISFFDQCYYYIELPECYLVHAGFNFDLDNPVHDLDSMLWIRNFIPQPRKINHKFVVHGHDPKTLSEIRNRIKERSSKIPLDNGCVHIGKYPGVGKLICLELNTFTLIEQDNIDQM